MELYTQVMGDLGQGGSQIERRNVVLLGPGLLEWCLESVV
jgi:hypothetical protein